MQPQAQQMQDMGMQMGQPMQSPEMTQQPASPEAQLNMQPEQPENQAILQQPNAIQAPNMMQNGNMNMAQPQIYEKPADEPKQEIAAAAPPPPNDPPFNNFSNENQSPSTTENLDDMEKKAADYRANVKKYLDDLSPNELDIFKQELNNKQPNPSPMDMQGTVK
ncbi:hypothetical protein LBMAG34_2470 [Candidatus Saccharibacteria bacterium]|nr:hypothetical protein LBMAG34_2470 [Candidatus Saccharibacteria bacterium]